MTDPSASATPKPPGVTSLTLFTIHGDTAWTIEQILQAFTDIHHSTFDYMSGKGKKDESKKTKVTAVNAHILGGVLHFFDEQAAVKIWTVCHAFFDRIPNKTTSGTVPVLGTTTG
jgi:hypothetical protein